ncbi:hypothetical protein HA402_002130 [Bradysia odoriphaga]|nr:hypothetical protein HA402_002130 [Bradysia odoriphaga]
MAECKNFKIAREFLVKHDWPMKLCDPRFDKCYCKKCYPSEYRDTYVVGGRTYVVPRNYTRFGVKIDEAYAEHLNIWNDWTNCFHGTSIHAAKSIVEHRMLLLPGEETMDGKQIKIRDGHIPGEIAFFTTPTIKYASLPAYASSYEFISPSTKSCYNITVVLQCKQKPGSFVVQPETVGSGTKKICSFIKNTEMEWRTKQRASIIPYGMLLHVEAVGSRLDGISRRCPSLTTKTFRLPEKCELDWIQVECPHCYHMQDWINPLYNQGKTMKCESRCCNVKFKPYRCPHCVHAYTVCKCFKRFSEEVTFPCDNPKCGFELMTSKCPHCKEGHNFSKLPDAPNQVVTVTCVNKMCKKKTYIVSECPHCCELKNIKTVVGKEGVVVTCSDPDCLKKYQLVECPKCTKVNAFPNAYSKVGRDDMVICSYRSCSAKFRQPLQPRVKGSQPEKTPIKSPGVKGIAAPRKRTTATAAKPAKAQLNF